MTELYNYFLPTLYGREDKDVAIVARFLPHLVAQRVSKRGSRPFEREHAMDASDFGLDADRFREIVKSATTGASGGVKFALEKLLSAQERRSFASNVQRWGEALAAENSGQ